MPDYHFAAFTLELVTPLHLGSGRAGMVAKSHAFVPAHVFGYALAAERGRQLGGQPEHFRTALHEVSESVRFAPAFALDGDERLATDWREHPERYLSGQHHVSLHLDSRSAAERALFEVEHLSPLHLHGTNKGKPFHLGGGLWFRADRFAGTPWPDWLNRLRLGGELKSGLGVVRVEEWRPEPGTFHGWGRTDGRGLHLASGERLWGASLDEVSGLTDAPLRPWLGRRYAFDQGRGGFGRHLGEVAFVRLHARLGSAADAVFLPCAVEGSRWGCWECRTG
jgi:hypothetical protein